MSWLGFSNLRGGAWHELCLNLRIRERKCIHMKLERFNVFSYILSFFHFFGGEAHSVLLRLGSLRLAPFKIRFRVLLVLIAGVLGVA